jgi:UDP-glucose 4-epimerase
MGSKLLITGGLGYIGSFTTRNFLKKTKTKAISIDNLSRGNKFSEKFSKNIKSNISNDKIKEIILNRNLNTVFHLASLTCVRESIKKTKKYYKSYQSQIKFIKNLRNTNIKYFIFSSSLSIFEKNKFKSNLSPYSRYKLKIEKYLKKIASENFKVIILRYPNIIGSSPDGKLGEKNSFINRIVPSFYKNIIKRKNNILFYDFSKKSFPKRNYIHVEDIADINVKIIQNLKKFKKNYHVFNINNQKQYSNIDVLKAISKIMKKKPKYSLKQIDKKESMSQYYKSKDNLAKYINFNVKYKNLEKILKTNIKWLKKIY